MSTIPMVHATKASGKMAFDMVEVFLNGVMERYMMVNG